MRKEAEREVVDTEVDKEDKQVAGREDKLGERMRVATSAGRIVALQKARAGWSKPSGELFCFIPSLFKVDKLK